jgi:hypothetical protein
MPHAKRIDAFTRWMVKREAKNRARGKPGYDQYSVEHSCGTPACMGGYLGTYPPFRRWNAAVRIWEDYLEVKYFDVFDSVNGCRIGPSQRAPKTALEAANFVRKLAKLPRLTKADTITEGKK